MGDRKNPEEPARTADPGESAEPGDERVVRRGEVQSDNEESATSTDDDRFDAG